MSGPFNVGDVVVCVDAAMTPQSYWSVGLLHEGRLYRVCKIRPTPKGITRLGFEQLPDPTDPERHFVYYASRFRKVDAADEQFTQQMRAIKPIRKEVSA